MTLRDWWQERQEEFGEWLDKAERISWKPMARMLIIGCGLLSLCNATLGPYAESIWWNEHSPVILKRALLFTWATALFLIGIPCGVLWVKLEEGQSTWWECILAVVFTATVGTAYVTVSGWVLWWVYSML